MARYQLESLHAASSVVRKVDHAISAAQVEARIEVIRLEREIAQKNLLNVGNEDNGRFLSMLVDSLQTTIEDTSIAADRFAESSFFSYANGNYKQSIQSKLMFVNRDGHGLDALPEPAFIPIDSKWMNEIGSEAALLGNAEKYAETLFEDALSSIDEIKKPSVARLQRVRNVTCDAIERYTEALLRDKVSDASPNSIVYDREMKAFDGFDGHQVTLDREGGGLPFVAEMWQKAGYELDGEIDASLALEFVRSLPISTYRRSNDTKKEVLVARGKSTDEMLTRRHVGPIRAKGTASGMISTGFGVIDCTDASTLASLNLKAVVALADRVETFFAKTNSIDLLLSKKSQSLDNRIELMKQIVYRRTGDDDGYKSTSQIAWEMMAAEAELSSQKIVVMTEQLKHQTRMKVAQSRVANRNRLFDVQSSAREHIDYVQNIFLAKREDDIYRSGSYLDFVTEQLKFMRSAASIRNSTLREMNIVALKVEAEISRETSQIIADTNLERQQENATLERIIAEGNERREEVLEVINLVFKHCCDGIAHLVSTGEGRRQIAFLLLMAAVIAFVTSASGNVIQLCRVTIEAIMRKPSLIRETTRKQFPFSLGSTILDWLARPSGTEEYTVDLFEDVLLSKELKERVLDIAKSTRTGRKYNEPCRHILLHGPPGTGKTMVARKLAKYVGMDYAFMSGGDVGPLRSDGSTQIHALFRWAKTSRKGVLLFIDEAESFLACRRKEGGVSEGMHSSLNALLYNTGSERSDFLILLATNRPGDLDAAVLDRIDVSLQFSLPHADCRRQLILHYFSVYISNDPLCNKHVEKGIMTGKDLDRLVNATEKFSAREIAKLLLAIKSKLYSTNCTLTSANIDDIVEDKVKLRSLEIFI